MLRRAAIVLILFAVSASALWAARHLGIVLPWDIAAISPEPSSKDREEKPPETPREARQSPAEKTIEDTTAALDGATQAPPPPPEPGKVTIDISRISPDGASVFAGRAAPDSYVTVLENGKPAGTAKTDADGEWSLSTEHRFASTDPKLDYEVSRTPPPPAPEPPPPQVAAKEATPPPAPPDSPSAASVAGEVMRKFENLVEEARKAAKKDEAKKDEAAKPDDTAKKDDETAKKGEDDARGQEEKAPARTAEAPDVEPSKPAPTPDSAAGATPEPRSETQPEAQAATPPDRPAAADTARDAATQEESSKEATPQRAPEPSPPAEAKVAAAPPAKEEDASKPASAQTDAIPVPIMFVYNEATLTPEGRRAAALLLEYLTLKKLAAVELTGHADERGSDAYNMDLSRERLEAVSQLLKEGGYTGELKLTPKGKSEPYMGVDRSRYKGEALYQLDRRVELRLNR